MGIFNKMSRMVRFFELGRMVRYFAPLWAALAGIGIVCSAPYLAIEYSQTTNSIYVFVGLLAIGTSFLLTGAFFLRRSNAKAKEHLPMPVKPVVKPKVTPERDEKGKFKRQSVPVEEFPIEALEPGDKAVFEAPGYDPRTVEIPEAENTMEVRQLTDDYILELAFESTGKKGDLKPIPVGIVQVKIGPNSAPEIQIPEPTPEMKKSGLKVDTIIPKVYRRVV